MEIELSIKDSLSFPLWKNKGISSYDMKRHWLLEIVKWDDGQWEIPMHLPMAWRGKCIFSCGMKRYWLVEKIKIVNFNWFPMTKNILNSIIIVQLVKNLKKPTLHFIDSFPTIPKTSWKVPQGDKQINKTKHLCIYMYMFFQRFFLWIP